jgi:phenylalanyl-tRNA synthetase beta chain
MKFTFNWLKDNLETSATAEEIAVQLTALGLEVENFTDLGKKYAPFIVAEILEATRHPNADKLQVCKVNNGKEVLQIVCGAPNARAGIKVCLAPVDALIPNGNFKIKKSKIRDVESNGMLCSTEELELGGDAAGIMELGADAVVGSKFADYKNLNDCLFEIAITPNRADCLGVFGVARDLAAAGLGKLIPINTPKIEHKGESPIKVSGAEYYIGCYIKNVTNGESCETNKRMLTSIGQTPISYLVDTTNLSNFEFARPLHVYDADKIKGNITVREAKKGEKLNALNNKSYEMQGGELVVADDNGIIALAGVIGNIETSVTAETKNVFLEVAYFNPIKVAESGRRHQIDTDARYRFERGIDVDFMLHAADLATACIGKEASEYVICGKKPESTREIEFDFEKIKIFAGIEIKKEEAEKILTALGFKIAANKITTPSWRADVHGPADIAEEILRVYGYDKVPNQALPYAAPAALPDSMAAKIAARKTLAAKGLLEVVTYSFIKPEDAKTFGGGNEALQLQNPISVELSEMRPSIIPNLLEAAQKNSNRGIKNIGLFEIGPVFGEKEQVMVAGIRAGKTAEKNIHGESRNFDAFDAKADLLAIIGSIGETRATAPSYYHPGRSGGVYLGKNCLGYFGELHPKLAKAYDLPSVAVFEVFLDNLPASRKKYKKLEKSDFQAVTRDFAFVLNDDVRADDLAANIRKTDQLIEKVNIFDVYSGDKIEKGKKSVALSVLIQPKDKTLTDNEIEAVSKKITDAVSQKFGGSLRQ